MLTHPHASTEASFAELRQREFARLDANRVASLDYAGSALNGIREFARRAGAAVEYLPLRHGLANNRRDIRRALDVVASFAA